MEVAWPAEGSRQRWVACVGNHRSKPLPLEEAKRASKELLNKPKAEPRDFIGELNLIAAKEIDDAYWTTCSVAYAVESNRHIPHLPGRVPWPARRRLPPLLRQQTDTPSCRVFSTAPG